MNPTKTRRNVLKAMGSGAAAAALPSSLIPHLASAAAATAGASGPKRMIFFIQNNGFHPGTCIPEGLSPGASLAKATLPQWISPLEPFKEKLTIINGLHGLHTNPAHSAYFGALGGYRGHQSLPPSAPTIDHVISQLLPQGHLPHLRIGMDTLDAMATRSTVSTLSAAGASKPLFMYSNPNELYQLLFGGIATGSLKEEHQAKSKVFNAMQQQAEQGGALLSGDERTRYDNFSSGFRDMNGLREQLAGISDHLKEFAPPVDERYLKPRFETDWHDVLLENGIAALKAGLTNVLTVGSGRGGVWGSYKGVGVKKSGHTLGHMNQTQNKDDTWVKIRQYNCQMLAKIIGELESVPEGSGTMMNNTLILYTSCCGDKQHTKGETWPFILIGDCAGRIKTDQFLEIKDRPINALYATLSHVMGAPCEHFNMQPSLVKKFDAGTGPLTGLLA